MCDTLVMLNFLNNKTKMQTFFVKRICSFFQFLKLVIKVLYLRLLSTEIDKGITENVVFVFFSKLLKNMVQNVRQSKNYWS